MTKFVNAKCPRTFQAGTTATVAEAVADTWLCAKPPVVNSIRQPMAGVSGFDFMLINFGRIRRRAAVVTTPPLNLPSNAPRAQIRRQLYAPAIDLPRARSAGTPQPGFQWRRDTVRVPRLFVRRTSRAASPSNLPRARPGPRRRDDSNASSYAGPARRPDEWPI